jgi:hypothetical protein
MDCRCTLGEREGVEVPGPGGGELANSLTFEIQYHMALGVMSSGEIATMPAQRGELAPVTFRESQGPDRKILAGQTARELLPRFELLQIRPCSFKISSSISAP